MKVLEVNVDDHLYGGVFVLVKNIIRNLPENITADIAALEPFDEQKHILEFESYGSSVYYVGSKRNKFFKQLDIYKNVKRIVDQNQYDVVHLHSDVSHKILVSAFAARKVKRLIFHSHSNDVEGSLLKLRRAFHRLCCVFLKRIPAVYIATSQEAGEWMFPWAKQDQIIILDNGIEYQRYRFSEAKREEKRKELELKHNDFLVGLFGRFVFQKNPFFAIDVLQEMLKLDRDVKMLCIGEGPLKQDFIQELKNRGMTDKVLLIGNTDTIEDYYQAIDALIMPSNFEGFGLVAVESQISGTPTFVSVNVPEVTQISDLICYLPIDEETLFKWRDLLIETKAYIKHDVYEGIDKKYELNTLIERIVAIYEG